MRSAASRSSAPASARVLPRRSEPPAAASDTRTARSAPMASALRSESTAFSGPSDTSTTSPPWASLIRSASSTAFRSVGLRVASPERSSRFVDGSIRLCTVASGTCFTQTAIFIGADSIGAETSLRDGADYFPGCLSDQCPGAPVPRDRARYSSARRSSWRSQSVALAADGAFQLVRTLGSEDVYVAAGREGARRLAHIRASSWPPFEPASPTLTCSPSCSGSARSSCPQSRGRWRSSLSRIDRPRVRHSRAWSPPSTRQRRGSLSVERGRPGRPADDARGGRRSGSHERGGGTTSRSSRLPSSSLLVATYETALVTGVVLAVGHLGERSRSTAAASSATHARRRSVCRFSPSSLRSPAVRSAKKPDALTVTALLRRLARALGLLRGLGRHRGVTLGLGPWLGRACAPRQPGARMRCFGRRRHRFRAGSSSRAFRREAEPRLPAFALEALPLLVLDSPRGRRRHDSRRTARTLACSRPSRSSS